MDLALDQFNGSSGGCTNFKGKKKYIGIRLDADPMPTCHDFDFFEDGTLNAPDEASFLAGQAFGKFSVKILEKLHATIR